MVPELSPERRYAEEAAVVLAAIGLTPAYGKLLGWLLICDPPQQTSGELAAALDLSKGSISTGMRMLERGGFVRRVPVPGRRGHAYEVAPDAIIRSVVEPTRFRMFRELMDRGVTVAGGPDSSRADRVRITRDFYAYVERELPVMVERFKAEHLGKGEADG
ncbi:GbsR/MarR family transcriptional regulator [Plantactinospora sp. WMMB334]|uniref:GbsR/MarR family transcriptional regulator n=1 Tax=Plantactinospora sp. WMMB334 TaxID=3404119 RepID=UPI003B932C17